MFLGTTYRLRMTSSKSFDIGVFEQQTCYHPRAQNPWYRKRKAKQLGCLKQPARVPLAKQLAQRSSRPCFLMAGCILKTQMHTDATFASSTRRRPSACSGPGAVTCCTPSGDEGSRQAFGDRDGLGGRGDGWSLQVPSWALQTLNIAFEGHLK